jgi:hypothetical protein
VLPDHPDLLAAVAAKLDETDDPNGNVRRAAISALAGVLPDHPDLLAAVAAKLDDFDEAVRSASVLALLPLLPQESTLVEELIPWLGCHFENNTFTSERVRQQLASALAPLMWWLYWIVRPGQLARELPGQSLACLAVHQRNCCHA